MNGVDYANRTVDYETLKDALYETPEVYFEDAESVIYRDYSGRGMYGASCFGLVMDSEADVVQVLIELSHDGEGCATSDRKDAVQQLARAMRSDSMGMSGIWYFPGWTLAGVPEDDES